MLRKKFNKRNNYNGINDSLGFDYQIIDEKQYWVEDVGYEFSKNEIDIIEEATNELHQMCFKAVQHVIDNNLYHLFNIPKKVIPYLVKSWEESEDWSLYGRFDFYFDGKKLKLYEYNADTPTSLLEASLAQHSWRVDRNLDDQFNSIDESMVAWWKEYKEQYNPDMVYFATVKENVEDFRNTEYIMDVATRAGIKTDFIFVEDIGVDGDYLYDLQNKKINYLFKLYPWEWIVQENEVIDTLIKGNCKVIEPVWKMILSNKALMAILWELFPNHKYLLKTSFNKNDFGDSYVKKPLLSREGQNVEIVLNGKVNELKEGVYASEHNIYQEVCILPKFEDFYTVIGSWVVGVESVGIGIREDASQITANMSQFVPHYISFKSGEEENLVEKENMTDAERKMFLIKKISQYNKKNQPLDQNDVNEVLNIIENQSKKMLKKSFNTSIYNYGVINIMEKLQGLFYFGVLFGTIFLAYKCEVDTIDHNEKIMPYNQKQAEFYQTLWDVNKRKDNLKWIKENVDPKNQKVFESFFVILENMVKEGTKDKTVFFDLDKEMMMNVFCIQGEKDVLHFETFQKQMYETEKLKEYLQALKVKYDYKNHKTTVPTLEEVVGYCKFDNLDRDLEQHMQKTKNIVIENE